MSKAQPIQAAGSVKLDMSKAQPIPAPPLVAKAGQPDWHVLPQAGDPLEDQAKESFQTLGREAGSAWHTITGIPSFLYHAAADPPTPEELKMLGLGKSTGPGRVANFVQRMIGGGQISEAARFYRQYVEATPEQKRDMETQMLSVAPEAIGAGAGAALLQKAPAAASDVSSAVVKGAAKVSDALPSKTQITAPVRAAVKGANTVLQKAPGSVGASIGASAGAAVAGHLGAEAGGAAGYALGRELLPGIRLPGENVGLPKTVEGGPASAPAYEPPEPLPFLPRRTPGQVAPEMIRPRAFAGRPADPIPPRSGLMLKGETAAEPTAAPSPTEPPPPNTPLPFLQKRTGDLIEQGLGGKALQPDVPLRQQLPFLKQEGEPLLDGHTPVESSWIKSYKYDPAAREFELAPKSGSAVRLGDVAPEDAQAFIESKSKGAAWQQLKQNPLVAKRVNGNWKPTPASGSQSSVMQKAQKFDSFIRGGNGAKPAAKAAAPPAASDPAATPDDQLLGKMTESVAQAKAKRVKK
jgi:hypothetical protein